MKGKLLIIDDETEILTLLELFFKQLNFKVITSIKLLSVAEIHRLDPTVVVVDYRVGDKLGSNLCLEIKSDPLLKSIPVILLSAHQDAAKIAKDACADACIIKPFDIAKLRSTIQRFAINNANQESGTENQESRNKKNIDKR
jgi:DNA-binding response OmpR family regulator